MTRIEWTYTAKTSRLLHALALAAFGAIGSLFVLGAALVAFVVAGSLLAGEVAVLAVLAAVAVLFARRLALTLVLARRERGLREYVSARELVAASVAWASVFAIAVRFGVGTRAVFGCVFAVAILCLSVGAALRSEGRVDTAAGVFEANGAETPLSTVDAVARYDVGPASVLRVRYHDAAAGSRSPRLLGVPRADAARIRDALEASDDAPSERDHNPLVAKTLLAFGAGALAVAAGFAAFGVQQGGDAAVVGAYGAAFAALFGVLFVWVGATER